MKGAERMTNIVIAGSREYTDYKQMRQTWHEYKEKHSLTNDKIHLISGGAKGADTLAERLAKEEGIKITVIRPDYSTGKGKQAPHIRNWEMAETAGKEGHLIAYYNKGKASAGTDSMVRMAQRKGMKITKING